MQSVTNKMKELEDMEKYVEKVKEDNVNTESEILAKVEEMKQTVARTKEANDMVKTLLFLDPLGTVWIMLVFLINPWNFFFYSMLEKFMERRRF